MCTTPFPKQLGRCATRCVDVATQAMCTNAPHTITDPYIFGLFAHAVFHKVVKPSPSLLLRDSASRDALLIPNHVPDLITMWHDSLWDSPGVIFVCPVLASRDFSSLLETCRWHRIQNEHMFFINPPNFYIWHVVSVLFSVKHGLTWLAIISHRKGFHWHFTRRLLWNCFGNRLVYIVR